MQVVHMQSQGGKEKRRRTIDKVRKTGRRKELKTRGNENKNKRRRRNKVNYSALYLFDHINLLLSLLSFQLFVPIFVSIL